MQDWGTVSVKSQTRKNRCHTSNAGEELSSKALNLTAWEGHESVALKKVEDTLAQKIRDYADVITEVETVP